MKGKGEEAEGGEGEVPVKTKVRSSHAREIASCVLVTMMLFYSSHQFHFILPLSFLFTNRKLMYWFLLCPSLLSTLDMGEKKEEEVPYF